MTLSPIYRTLAALALGASMVAPAQADTFSTLVDAQGNISLPEDFRGRYAHLGSWFVPEGGASGFHDVYTQPDTVRAYRDTGRFPDGAVLVKELRSHDAGDYSTGQGVKFATSQIKQWFVMVKDTQGRFPDNGAWGDGWGWALFKGDAAGTSASQDYRADCIDCHAPAEQNDWVYVEGYPTLQR